MFREELYDAYVESFGDELLEEQTRSLGFVFDTVVKEEVRRSITIDKLRPDGRKPEEIRPITCKVGILPRTWLRTVYKRSNPSAYRMYIRS